MRTKWITSTPWSAVPGRHGWKADYLCRGVIMRSVCGIVIVDGGCGGRSQNEDRPLKVDLKEQNDKEATGKERKIG
eukprot:scaffold2735_cov65-Cyclotella_meneghiniana.AAC.1